MMEREIWTIGHSTHFFEYFLEMLKSFQIELVADIRRYPGSRRFPQFNLEAIARSLPENNFDYVHFKALGGRRTPRPDSRNDGWRVPAFRAYADYMGTSEFKTAVGELEAIGKGKRSRTCVRKLCGGAAIAGFRLSKVRGMDGCSHHGQGQRC